MSIKSLKYIALFLVLFNDLLAVSQNIKSRCSTGKLIEEAQEKPEYIATQEKISEAIKNYKFDKTDTVITIPVVVHVLYKNQRENIYDDQIYSQIEVLNEDFRKLNSDISSVPSQFSVADIKIEFCLAKTDPNGNYTPGITRVPTTLDNIGINKTYYTVSPSWGNEYLNIWVCDFGNNVAGEATPPGTAPADRDGVIVDYLNFGTIGTVEQPYHLGRTVNHEVGHWLDLFHIWGKNNNNPNCSNDDEVADTPDQSAIHVGCPASRTTCGSLDMLTNYMGYVDDACMANFTEGQKTRMRAALLSARSTVVNSDKGCNIVSVNNHSVNSSIAVFPNPIRNEFSVKLEKSISLNQTNVLLISSLGIEVPVQIQQNSNIIQIIPPSNLKGIYFLRLYNQDITVIKKLIFNN